MAAGTRERILDVAWDLFCRQGVAGTTVTQIEAAASLAAGSGSFYRHFRSKDDVFEKTLERELDRVAAVRHAEREVDDAGEDVRTALTLEFERRLENWDRIAPLISVVQREREHLGAARKRMSEVLIERNLMIRAHRLKSWMDAGAIPRRDPEALAATILFALTGFALARGHFGDAPADVSKERVIAVLVDLVTAASDATQPSSKRTAGTRR